MSNDNKIVSINVGQHGEPGWAEREKDQFTPRDQLIDLLTNLVAYVAMAPPHEQFALALFHEDETGQSVQCGGFRDDQAAGKYLAAFMRNQGFAQ